MNKSKCKNNRRRSKKFKGLTDIPFVACIFIIVAGILVGNAMIIGTWHWNKLISRDEALPVSATFDSYSYIYVRNRSISNVDLYFSDCDQYSLVGVRCSSDLKDSLDDLKTGDKLDMLVHPNSSDIWELKKGNDVLFSFDEAFGRIMLSNVIYTAGGVFMYFVAVVGVVSLIMKILNRRKANRQLQN